MIYAGIDVDIITHEKALRCGVAAFGLWTWGLCWSQKHKTDGRLPLVAVMSALDEDRRVLRRAAVRLVTSGLWVESADGSFTAHNYANKNQTADEIERKKTDAADRKERWLERKKKADENAFRLRAGTPLLPPSPSLQLPPPLPLPDPAPGSEDGAEPVTGVSETPAARFKYREAYASGIAKGKGSPYAWPPGPKADEWADKDLGLVITTFARSRSTGKAIRSPDLLLWISAAAEDFSSQVAEGARAGTDDPKYWSNYAPKGLLRFLNQESTAEEARNVG